jgi:hypothetical protein
MTNQELTALKTVLDYLAEDGAMICQRVLCGTMGGYARRPQDA